MIKSTPKEESSRKKKYSAPALEKGLDILELLSTEVEGLSLGDIAKRLNRSVGELFRMLAVLEQRGYVSLPPGADKWVLTLRMFGLAHRFPPINKLTTTAGPVMQRLSFDIEQSCHLVIYYEGKGHVVVQQDSPSERVFSVRLGAEAPLLNTCSGHLLLAYANEQQRERMLDRVPDCSPRQRKEIQKIIKRVLEQGCETIKSAQAQGVQDIGYPVFDYTGQVVAALVVPFFAYLDGSHPVKIGNAMDHLEIAAKEISEKLGYAHDFAS